MNKPWFLFVIIVGVMIYSPFQTIASTESQNYAVIVLGTQESMLVESFKDLHENIIDSGIFDEIFAFMPEAVEHYPYSVIKMEHGGEAVSILNKLSWKIYKSGNKNVNVFFHFLSSKGFEKDYRTLYNISKHTISAYEISCLTSSMSGVKFVSVASPYAGDVMRHLYGDRIIFFSSTARGLSGTVEEHSSFTRQLAKAFQFSARSTFLADKNADNFLSFMEIINFVAEGEEIRESKLRFCDRFGFNNWAKSEEEHGNEFGIAPPGPKGFYGGFAKGVGFLYNQNKNLSSIEDDIKQLSSLPKSFYLSQNYPNPFNPTTTIEFSLPRTSQVNLTVCNLIGQKIEILLDEQKQAGHHQVIWDASQSPAGVYFLRFKAGDFSKTIKMMLVK